MNISSDYSLLTEVSQLDDPSQINVHVLCLDQYKLCSSVANHLHVHSGVGSSDYKHFLIAWTIHTLA